jgi:membrane-associated phospholipid phosphatase
MFDTDSILWLQSWSSPAVTAVMLAISVLGYTRALVAFAVAVAFGWRLRAGLIVLVLLGMNAVITDVAKTSVAAPRPDAVDARVRPIGLEFLASVQRDSRFARWPTPGAAIDAEDRLGFPSGHVSGATVFLVAMALLTRCKWIWVVTAAGVALMAVSRMYLGRHFLGDVVGGLFVGLATVSIGLAFLQLRAVARLEAANDRGRAVGLLLTCALAVASVALMAGTPDAGDAGRFLGLAAGTALVTNATRLADSPPWRVRCLRLVIAVGSFSLTWFAVIRALQGVDSLSMTSKRLLAIALPSMVMLILPVFAGRGPAESRARGH